MNALPDLRQAFLQSLTFTNALQLVVHLPLHLHPSLFFIRGAFHTINIGNM